MMKNMGYDEFKKKILSLVAEKLGKTIKADIIPINKKDSIKDAVGIDDGINGLKPLVYAESLYDQYCAGADLTVCAGFVIGLYHAKPDFYVGQYFESWEEAQSRITIRIVNLECNQAE